MNEYVSKKIKILGLILMLVMVYAHGFNLTTRFLNDTQTVKQFDVNSFVQLVISEPGGIGRVPIPLFFLFSGYLFFLNFKPTLGGFIAKYKRRFFSLVVPFLLWNIFGVLFLYILQSIPASKPFFTNELIRNYSAKQVIDVVFYRSIPHQLWFLRELIVFVAVSPLIYFCVSKLSYFLVIPFMLVWILDVNIIFPNNVVFFMFGAYLAIKEVDVGSIRMKPSLAKALLFIWIGVLFIITYLNLNDLPRIPNLERLTIVLGLLAVWFNYDIILKSEWITNKLLRLAPYTFFIYVAHAPAISIIKKIILRAIGVSPYTGLFTYLATGTIMTIVLIGVGAFLEKNANSFYNVITGGRSSKRRSTFISGVKEEQCKEMKEEQCKKQLSY